MRRWWWRRRRQWDNVVSFSWCTLKWVKCIMQLYCSEIKNNDETENWTMWKMNGSEEITEVMSAKRYVLSFISSEKWMAQKMAQKMAQRDHEYKDMASFLKYRRISFMSLGPCTRTRILETAGNDYFLWLHITLHTFHAYHYQYCNMTIK